MTYRSIKRREDFDREFRTGFRFGIAAWLVLLFVNLIVIGVVLWAIVKLVTHYT